ncbi:GTP binding protein [Aureococcus anophagefferens]|nr:GTP binding protein [Aureococcus anophagefferens]
MSKEESKSRDGEGKDEGKDGEEKDGAPFDDEAEIKLILLGDSAVGKTKMVERFLMDEYNPQQARGPPRARAPRGAAPPPRCASAQQRSIASVRADSSAKSSTSTTARSPSVFRAAIEAALDWKKNGCGPGPPGLVGP